MEPGYSIRTWDKKMAKTQSLDIYAQVKEAQEKRFIYGRNVGDKLCYLVSIYERDGLPVKGKGEYVGQIRQQNVLNFF